MSCHAVGYVLMVIALPDPDGATEMVAPWPDFLMGLAGGIPYTIGDAAVVDAITRATCP